LLLFCREAVVCTIVAIVAAYNNTSSIDAKSEACKRAGDIYGLEVFARSDETVRPENRVHVTSDEISSRIKPRDRGAHHSGKVNLVENPIAQQESVR
jgi:hypothetical protein